MYQLHVYESYSIVLLIIIISCITDSPFYYELTVLQVMFHASNVGLSEVEFEPYKLNIHQHTISYVSLAPLFESSVTHTIRG